MMTGSQDDVLARAQPIGAAQLKLKESELTPEQAEAIRQGNARRIYPDA